MALPPNRKWNGLWRMRTLNKMSDSEHWYYLLDDDEDNSSEESLPHPNEVKGSSSMEIDDIFDKAGEYQQMVGCVNSAPFPPYTKNRKDYELRDVIRDYVLPFLPAKTLIRFTSVAKDWEQWIRSPFLAHQQSYIFKSISGFFCQYHEWKNTFISLNDSAYGVPTPPLTFLPELVNIRSSSNGLLLCQGKNGHNSYYICNPATEDWKWLPGPKYYHGSEPAVILAFEPSVLNIEAHYNVICAVPMIGQPFVLFEVYSSKTRTWTVSNTICVELGDSDLTENRFYMNGIVYWETSTRKVLAFDMKNEICGVMSLPSDVPINGVLTQMQDELCYIGISNTTGNEYSIQIYGGMGLSLKWKMDVHLEVEFHDDPGYCVLPYVDGDAVMVLVGTFVYSCSLKDQRAELISTEGVDPLVAVRYLPYVNSLVQVA